MGLATLVNTTHRVQAPTASRYWLGFVQAWPKESKSQTCRIVGEVSYENPGGDQLPVQQRGLSTTFLVLVIAFFGSTVWFLMLVVLRRRGRTRLHAFMLANLATKCCVLLLMRNDVDALSRTGRTSRAREASWQLLQQVQLIMEVMLLYFIGLGYKVTRSHLKPSEQAFAATIVCVSLCLGTFEVLCNTYANCSGTGLRVVQFTLHAICFLVVIVAVNFNIFSLQRQISEALATPETGTLYAKHGAYCWFRGFFLYFVVIPSVINYLRLHIVTWRSLWVIDLVQEGSLWVIYTGIAWLFRPGAKSIKVFELAVVESSASEDDD
jgi:hypothetical protein